MSAICEQCGGSGYVVDVLPCRGARTAVESETRCGPCHGTGEILDREAEALRIALAPEHIRGQRENAIIRAGYRVTGFWSFVHEIIDDPAVIAAHPVECRLLRERRDRRNTARGH